MPSYRMTNDKYYSSSDRLLGSNAMIKDIVSKFLNNCVYRIVQITFDVFVGKIYTLYVLKPDRKEKEQSDRGRGPFKKFRKKKDRSLFNDDINNFDQF